MHVQGSRLCPEMSISMMGICEVRVNGLDADACNETWTVDGNSRVA
jgi:hypothetical protein